MMCKDCRHHGLCRFENLVQPLSDGGRICDSASVESVCGNFEASTLPSNLNKAYDGQIVLFTGTEFTATDKLGKTYRYRMIGAEVTRDGLIRLLNLDTNSLTYVEPEWFRQRKIKVIQKEQE